MEVRFKFQILDYHSSWITAEWNDKICYWGWWIQNENKILFKWKP